MRDGLESPARTDDRIRAIGFMALAVLMFSGLDSAAKYLAAQSNLPIAQIVWMRFAGQFIGMAILLGPWRVPNLIKTCKPWVQIARSVLMAATTACNFLALEHLRLDQTVTVAFLAPLVVAALAGPMLGEWPGWRRLLAILVGFTGILIAVRPGMAGVHPAIGYALASMVFYAVFMLLTRYLSAYDPPLTTLFYSILAGTVGVAPLALADWVWPASVFEWVLLAALGSLGGVGHYFFIQAYARAPASVVSPFLYLQLLMMIGLGWIIFGDAPDAWTLAGAGVIVASGVYLFHRERVTAGPRR